MEKILNTEIFILTLVVGIYLVSVWFYRRTKLAFLHPLLISIPVLAVLILSLIHI